MAQSCGAPHPRAAGDAASGSCHRTSKGYRITSRVDPVRAIEVASAGAMSWQFSVNDPERREHLTPTDHRNLFFALALFVTVDSVRSLTGNGEAQHSLRASFPPP